MFAPAGANHYSFRWVKFPGNTVSSKDRHRVVAMKTMRAFLFVCMACWVSDVSGQEKKQEKRPENAPRISSAARRRDSEAVRQAFKPVVAKARKSVVKIKIADKVVGLGTIVGSDGWIVTKGSLVAGEPVCQLDDGKEHKAAIIGIDERNDLAALKIDVKNLPVAEMAETVKLKPGQWAVSAGNSELPIAIGVVSGPVRTIIPGQEVRRPMLGVGLLDTENGVCVISLTPNGGAIKAGVKMQDFILEINQLKVTSQEHLREILASNQIGATVILKVRRDKEQIELKAVLGDSTVAAIPGGGRNNDRQTLMNQSTGRLSERRSSFPKAFQHDSVIRPEDCGGPLLNLEGKVVGINISRSGCTESLAIPVDHLRDQMFRLMSGELAPKPAVKKDEPKSDDKSKEKPAPAKSP